MYHLHTRCRACGAGIGGLPSGTKTAESGKPLIPVLDLGLMPLSNDFKGDGEEREGFAPLKVLFCPQCSLAQLSVVVKPEILYANYPYVTSKSATMMEHFKALVDDMAMESPLSTVLEIGSNTGEFLKYIKSRFNSHVEGIDPAENLAVIANKNGIETTIGYLDSGTAKAFSQDMKPVDCIVLRHVWAHIDDWQDAISALEILSNKDTLICIEVPWVMDQIDAVSFDQIYFEHLSYVSVRSIVALLIRSPFYVRKVIRYPIHGGCISLMVKRKDAGGLPDETVTTFVSGLEVDNTVDRWQSFSDETEIRIMMLRNKVHRLREQGKRVVGYGASAKCSTWIHACKFTRNDLSCVYDETLQKVYKTIPGTEIPVVHEGAFYVDNPDYAVCFAWNFFDEIYAKQLKWHNQGGHWIKPVPKVVVV